MPVKKTEWMVQPVKSGWYRYRVVDLRLRSTDIGSAILIRVEVDDDPRTHLGIGYAMAGRLEDARNVLAELEAVKLSGWTAWFRAAINSWLGNKGEAFRMLDFRPHHDWLAAVGIGLEFKPLRGDPRLHALRKRMNLPPV